MKRLKDPDTPVHAWFVADELAEPQLLERLAHSQFTGAVLSLENVETLRTRLSPSLLRIMQTPPGAGDKVLELCESSEAHSDRGHYVVLSADTETLAEARRRGLTTCLEATVTDGPSLHQAIALSRQHRYVLLRFADPTNIPLELVIAELQDSNTIVVKNVAETDDVETALVSLGVMETGSDGVLFSPASHAIADEFLMGLTSASAGSVPLQPARITKSVAVGMGQRSCIDTVTLFSEHEGIVVGSTSQGGFLCCSEVFYLPYMEKRPFRVNAGGIHSYVYLADGRTQYMSELSAGSRASVVDTDGVARSVPVGRIKTEVRPLRLLEAEFESGEQINIFMQDDWHVRIFGADGGPRNITELVQGDSVLAHLAAPGRHVGIPISETIEER